MADDLGYGDLSSYNSDAGVNTPHMDSLAANGIRFTNAHTNSAVCSPTRYTLMTGQYAFREGYYGAVGGYGTELIDPGRQTIAELMRDADYNTAMIGKWHLGLRVQTTDGQAPQGGSVQSPTPPANPNIDWSASISAGPADHGFDYFYGHMASADIPPYKYVENDTFVTPETVWTSNNPDILMYRYGWGDPDWDPRQNNRVITDRSVDYINQASTDEPFFLNVSLPSPHTPTAPHPDFQTARDDYLDFLTEVDDTIGRITQALEDRGVLDNTLIILTSDNGAWAREANVAGHRGTGVLDSVNLRGNKADAWEGGHRVPMIVRWGDGTAAGSVITPGQVNSALQNTADFMATLAALVDQPIAQGQAEDSFNQLGVWLGEEAFARDFDINVSSQRTFSIREIDEDGNEWKLILNSNGNGGGFGGIGDRRDPADPLVTLDDFASVQLYNMSHDPGEQSNLLLNGGAVADRERAEALRQRLVALMDAGRSAQAVLPGDLSGDGFVGIEDLDLLLANWGEQSWYLDQTGDGRLDQADLDAVRTNWGNGTPPETTVPEPASALGLGGMMLMCLRRGVR